MITVASAKIFCKVRVTVAINNLNLRTSNTNKIGKVVDEKTE